MSVRLTAAVVLAAGAGLAALAITEKPERASRPAIAQAEPAPAPGSAIPTSPSRPRAAPPPKPAPTPTPTLSPTPALEPSGIVPSIALEAFLSHDYPAYWHHKAIAVGPDGVFAAAFREPDPDAAIAAAQKKCAEKLRWHPNPAHREVACRSVAVNEAVALSPDPDAMIAAGDVALAETSPPDGPRAVWKLLEISACGVNDGKAWQQGWRDFFAASRVTRVHLALSAPPGAPDPCPRAGAAYDRFVRWNRARLKATLDRLRSPSRAATQAATQEVVIWADAGAADVVHASRLAPGVRVITTNAPCTLTMSRHSLLPGTIKVTAFVTRAHAALERAARRRALPGIEAACAEAAKDRPGLDVVALPGKPRFPVWNADIMAKLAAVTGLPPIRLMSDPPERLNFLPFEAHRFFTKTFTLHATNRAMVLSGGGRIFIAAGHTHTAEAVQEALYQCRSAAGGNGFIPSLRASCILFAVNDEIVFRES